MSGRVSLWHMRTPGEDDVLPVSPHVVAELVRMGVLLEHKSGWQAVFAAPALVEDMQHTVDVCPQYDVAEALCDFIMLLCLRGNLELRCVA